MTGTEIDVPKTPFLLVVFLLENVDDAPLFSDLGYATG